ncbi:Rne/Rng family ribonuclease [Schaalia suimastitidis]|uniref:Rne/Rng family ribonuclease n=1 Tax=Schaalia suimastitidis TaxID=121163 RepID=UPI00054FFB5A|nr:Rne/Rng family ribonuclease [Schaalia suimastitidis]
MPETPAASLLFQAPAFQAPVFVAPSIDEAPAKPRRKAKSEATTAEPSVDGAEDVPPKTKKRRTTKTAEEDATSSKRARRSRKVVDETPEEPAVPEDVEPVTVEVDSEDTNEDSDGTSRRRRRRRTRSVVTDEDDSGDLNDQVTALKGSTRLEAKKQRRRDGRKEGRRRHGLTESEFLARRESVNRVMVIRHQDGLDQIAILEDDLLVEHYVARRTQTSMVGNIYLGRVQNVLPSMEAAFVDIGRGRNAVLYAGEVNWDAVGLEGRPRRIESALQSGDAVLVQVTKDPIGHKGARLTSQITLAGRYLVLIPGGSMMGISRKLPDKERTRLKRILKEVVPQGAGVIVRTAAEGASEEQIAQDVERLSKQWVEIEEKQQKNKAAPVLLRGEPELAVRVVRDIFNEDFSALLIQGKETYHTVRDYVEELSPELSERVQHWVSNEDVFAAHRIDEQLAKGMDRKVWLPSGGTLVIDRTEAMTVVDVNTGKFIGAGGTLEETVTKNNLEAAEEIVRQLRLRDIGGIVIIDFVDMVLESNRDLVLRRLVECLGRDRTRHQVTEITSLGLVQMTRKRVGEGLVEAFSTTCQTCEGRGFIVHHHPVESEGTPNKKKKKNAPEPRRIEDGPERERAREALSAIAAASTHREETSSKDDTAELSDAAGQPDDAVATADIDETRAKDSVSLNPVAVAPSGPQKQKTARVKLGQEAPVKRKRARRVATSESNEPSVESALPEPTPQEETAAVDKGGPRPFEESAQASPAPKKRRRAASLQSAEPQDRSSRAESIVLPPVVQDQASPRGATSLDEIVLPERSQDAPKTRKRRRAVSTGVVSTGE